MDNPETPNNSPDWERRTLEKLLFAAVAEQKARRRWGIFFKALGFAYLVLATEDKQWGDLVAPRAREARAVVEPQLSGPDLIHADALIAAYKQRKK